MCGIGGVYLTNGRRPGEAELQRMSLAMRSRGPDDDGVFADAGIGLVHRRLSIIDLSEAGRCPIANEDGTVHAVHNGEIYNFEELRKDLAQRGHAFRSRCDSEVVVHAYEEWGTSCFARMDGMFASAIWDGPRRRLVFARDRIGEKPLYVHRRPGLVAFASTLNAIRALVGDDLEVDPRAIECFLSHSFIPHPHTIWKGVESLPPAHLGVVEAGGDLRVERYWDFPARPPERIGVDEAEARMEEEIDRSVRARLIADVPVGGFLSGGVDSSLVMAMTAKHSPHIDTFSVGFAEEEFSELPHARRVAEHIGSRHHELVFDESAIHEVLPELVWQYGQPFGDSSAVPTHLVSRLARDHVKVALSGDGGDESFAGYRRASSGWYASLLRAALPAFVRRHGLPAVAGTLRSLGAGSVATRLSALNSLSLAPPGQGYNNHESWLDHRDALFGDELSAGLSGHQTVGCRSGRPHSGTDLTDLQQILYDDFQVLLADDYLVKVDVASMAASLEVRPPLLSHHLVESAWILPDALKLRRGQRKWILKRIAARHVPPEVVYRPKRGFAMPMRHWWRGDLSRILQVLMRDSRCVERGWLRREAVEQRIDDHVAGRAEHPVRLWLVLWLELWVRVVLEGSMDRGASLADLAGE